MKKNFKVIKLSGMAGLIIPLIAVLVVAGSLLILPVYGIKFLWNGFISQTFDIQAIRLSQASLLWFAAISLIYGYLRKRICFKFVNVANMDDNSINPIDYDKFIEKIKEEQEENEKINR